MQSVEIVVKAAGDPMVLTFSASDSADVVAERLRVLTWIVRQLDGHSAEPRRRAPRADRSAPPTTADASIEE